MTDDSESTRGGRFVGAVIGPFAFRPRLTSGIGLGIMAFVLSRFAIPAAGASTRAIVSWDLTCLWFLVLTLIQIGSQTQAELKAHVAAHDEGRDIIVTTVVIAAAASLCAVGYELSLAKAAHGLEKELRVGLALITVVLSWLTSQTIYALHYAHAYYAPDRTTANEDDVVGGLSFPGDEEPDNWDFMHFAFVIGVASQTADIAFTAERTRRIGTGHSLISFTFNTAVLALTINLLAGLF